MSEPNLDENLIEFVFFLCLELSSDIGKVKCLSTETYFIKASSGVITIKLHNVAVDRGMAWDEAHGYWTRCKTPQEGFYVVQSVSAGSACSIGIANCVSFSSRVTLSARMFS